MLLRVRLTNTLSARKFTWGYLTVQNIGKKIILSSRIYYNSQFVASKCKLSSANQMPDPLLPLINLYLCADVGQPAKARRINLSRCPMSEFTRTHLT